MLQRLSIILKLKERRVSVLIQELHPTEEIVARIGVKGMRVKIWGRDLKIYSRNEPYF